MLFGSNLPTANQTIFRSYNTPSKNVPSSFPGTGVISSGVVPYVSFRPDISEVLAGNLDDKIQAYAEEASAGTLLTAWHECNLPHLGLNAKNIVDMHARISHLVHEANPDIFYGEVFGTYRVYTSSQKLAPWFAPGLDFYGFDGYQEKESDTVDKIFDEAVQQIIDLKSDARLIITETNTYNPELDQGAWLHSVMDYAVENDFVGYLFWAGPNHAGSVCPTPSQSLINELSVRAATSSLWS